MMKETNIGDTPMFHWNMIMGERVAPGLASCDGFWDTPAPQLAPFKQKQKHRSENWTPGKPKGIDYPPWN